ALFACLVQVIVRALDEACPAVRFLYPSHESDKDPPARVVAVLRELLVRNRFVVERTSRRVEPQDGFRRVDCTSSDRNDVGIVDRRKESLDPVALDDALVQLTCAAGREPLRRTLRRHLVIAQPDRDRDAGWPGSTLEAGEKGLVELDRGEDDDR